MKLRGYPNIGRLESIDDLRRYVSVFLQLLPPILNHGIEFGENIRSTGVLSFSIKSANEIVRVPHSLRYVPQGYLIVYQDSNPVIYAPDVTVYPYAAWTGSEVYLTAAATVNARVILF